MSSQDQPQDLTSKLDECYLIDVLTELAKVSTEVPLGADTFMEPDDPKLVHYVQKILRPKLMLRESQVKFPTSRTTSYWSGMATGHPQRPFW